MGFPRAESQNPIAHPFGIWNLGFGISAATAAVAYALLKDGFMLNPAVLETADIKSIGADFWLRLFNDKALQDCDDLEKLVIGCEIIAALEAVDLVAA